MTIHKDYPLAGATSFHTGGNAEYYVEVEELDELRQSISELPTPFWLLGDGANVLVSDNGLRGTTIHLKLDEISTSHDNEVTAHAGASWDKLVTYTLSSGLWGLELMSGIPGTVGAAVVGNIAAYGQAVSDTLVSIEVLDLNSDEPTTRTMQADELNLSYRSSAFTKGYYNNIIILSATFKLSPEVITELKYNGALAIAKELSLDVNDLNQRREIIMEHRKRAGSLIDPHKPQLTAGSFFKNPLVDSSTAEQILEFEEREVTKQAILEQNKIHGGDEHRVSASLVLLAAGFERGQTWGNVRLNPKHILKIENVGEATSQEIYDVAQHIIKTVHEKLAIELEPEVRFLGNFS